MAYLGKCAIHASSPRIWRRLINFGLHPNPCGTTMIARSKKNRICTVVQNGSFFNATEDEISEGIHDCENNDELFFALAALRDDSDINQWFIYDNRAWNDDNPVRCWFICKQESIEDDMCYDCMFTDCEKATERELILHFNGDDDDEIVTNQQ